ncbi:MAG: lasso RiPP family leader peptide-containing protein [Pseudomonadota bacterium]
MTDDAYEQTEPATMSKRRPYEAPVVEDLGDVRDVTMGGSPGTTDSGNQFVECPFGGGPGVCGP